MRDCLVLVDVFDDFGHEDGEALLASFGSRFPCIRSLLRGARERGIPVVYANDTAGIFDGDAQRVVERARSGPAGERIDELVPAEDDRFVIKPRYSAFDSTPLRLILRELDIERIVVAGMTTEGCVTQTAIDGKEEGFKVTVVPAACATIEPEVEKIALAYLERVVGVKLQDVAALGVAGSARVETSRIAAVPALAELPAAELEELGRAMTAVAVDAGQAIVTADDYGSAVYFVEEGEADVLVDREPPQTLGPGDAFGEIALLLTGQRTATVVARTPMRLLSLSGQDFERIQAHVPELERSLRRLGLERSR